MLDEVACGRFTQHLMDPEVLALDASVLFESEQNDVINQLRGSLFGRKHGDEIDEPNEVGGPGVRTRNPLVFV